MEVSFELSPVSICACFVPSVVTSGVFEPLPQAERTSIRDTAKTIAKIVEIILYTLFITP